MAGGQGFDKNSTVYKDRYIILGIVLTGILMSVLDGNVVGIALPAITQVFHVDLALSQWTATAYLLTITSTLLIFGKLSEYTGKTKMYISGFAVFTLGSLACGLAPGIYELIAFRVLQGIGGAMVAGIGAAILFMAFPPEERGRAMGYIGAVSGVGCVIGPGLGGFLVEHCGWGSVFLINVPIGIALLAAAFRFLKLPEEAVEKRPIDWIGAAALILAASSLLLFLDEISSGPQLTWNIVLFAGSCTGGLIVFLLQERRAKEPLMDLSAFRELRFTLPLAGLLISFTATLLLGVVAPFYFEIAFGYPASTVGYIMFIPPVIMIAGAPIGGLLVDKHPWKYYSAAGMGIMALALALMGFFATRMDLAPILLSLALFGLGEALFTSPNSNEVMGALPRKKTGIASSAAAVARNLGMSLGVAMAAAILTLQLAGTGSHAAFAPTPAAIAGAVSLALYFAAALCILGALLSSLRNAGIRPLTKMKAAASS